MLFRSTQVKDYMGGDEFSDVVKGTVQQMIDDLQNDVEHPFSKQQTQHLVQNGAFKIDGGVMSTQKGSIINLNNAANPWIQCSDEVAAWAKDFATYLKNGMVSKLLSESVDPDGGYLVPEEFRNIMIMYDSEDTLV